MTRIDFTGDADGSRGSLKDGFGDVVRVSTVVHQDVQIAHRIRGKALPKIFDQLAVEFTDFGRWHFGLKNQKRTTAEVDSAGHQRFFHRQNHVAIAPNPMLDSQALIHGLAEANADVFGGVVRVHLQVARCMDVEVNQGMSREQNKHVVEEADTRIDIVLPRTIECQFQLDLCFGSLSRYGASAVCRHILLLAFLTLIDFLIRPSFGRRVHAFR